MKTKEELEQIKEEYSNLSNKLAELSEGELIQVTGGSIGKMDSVFEGSVNVQLEKERKHKIK